MYTVVARFHHASRDLDEIESTLRAEGAGEALVTGYTVAMTFEAGSHKDAAKVARRILDGVGATRIKITKRGGKLDETDAHPLVE